MGHLLYAGHVISVPAVTVTPHVTPPQDQDVQALLLQLCHHGQQLRDTQAVTDVWLTSQGQGSSAGAMSVQHTEP